jgi:hypothetical protein
MDGGRRFDMQTLRIFIANHVAATQRRLRFTDYSLRVQSKPMNSRAVEPYLSAFGPRSVATSRSMRAVP